MITKLISEILTEVRDTLQDKQKSRWEDQELFRYLNQANRDIALQTKYNQITHTIYVVDGVTTYTLPYESIEFYDISAVQPYEITDPLTLEFKDSAVEEVIVDYYAYPAVITYGVHTTVTLEQDLLDALVQYILFKSYQKEDTPENFSKSQYFKNEYRLTLSRGGRWNGQFDVSPHKTDFYT